MGLIELIIIVAVVALIARGIGMGHVVFWLATIAGVALLVGLFMTVARHSLIQYNARNYELSAELADELAERQARGEVVPPMYGEHGPAQYPVTALPHPRIKGVAFLGLLAIPAVMFAATRRCRHRGTAGLLPLAGLASVAMLLGGLYFVRSRSLHDVPATLQATPPRTASVPAGLAEANVPVDELWERLTEPRISMEGRSAEEIARTEDETAAREAVVQAAIQVATLAQEKLRSIGAGVNAAAANSELVPAESPHIESDDLVSESDATVASAPVSQPLQVERQLISTTAQPRPDWIEHPPKLDGPVERIVVQAGPYSTLTECHEVLRQEVARAVKDRIQELANNWMNRPAWVPEIDEMQLGNAQLVRELLVDQFVETTHASVGEMKTAWALLEFDQADDQRLLAAWHAYARRDGIAVTGVASLMVLGALGLVYGLISVDTWTRGYYTKRLFLGVPAAIIAFIMLIAAMS